MGIGLDGFEIFFLGIFGRRPGDTRIPAYTKKGFLITKMVELYEWDIFEMSNGKQGHGWV